MPYFLHQQPELTTLPDGDIFVSQLEAIKISHEMCKQLNLKLIIESIPQLQRILTEIGEVRYLLIKFYHLVTI